MDIVGKARQLESRISRTLDGAVQNLVGTSPRQPIEIVHAIVARVEEQVQPAGRGGRVFPFNRIAVHIPAASKAEKARFAVLAEGPPPLRERILERLRAAGCEPAVLAVEVAYAPKPKATWPDQQFHIEFDRVDVPSPAPPVPLVPPRLELAIVSGVGERRTYSFQGGRIDLGRRADVVDDRQRLVRVNHVVFRDGEAGPNATVSRRHAHVTFDAASGQYRIHDDRSAHGTAVVREGQTLPVPAGSRGVRLREGDEILLGQARIRVKVGGGT